MGSTFIGVPIEGSTIIILPSTDAILQIHCGTSLASTRDASASTPRAENFPPFHDSAQKPEGQREINRINPSSEAPITFRRGGDPEPLHGTKLKNAIIPPSERSLLNIGSLPDDTQGRGHPGNSYRPSRGSVQSNRHLGSSIHHDSARRFFLQLFVAFFLLVGLSHGWNKTEDAAELAARRSIDKNSN
jgi:hypothetical protein